MPSMPAPRSAPSREQAYVPPKLTPIRPSETPRVRAQSDEPIPVQAFRIPSPEELGIGTKAKMISGDEPVDWTMVERQLDRMGARGHQLDRLEEGGYRFLVKLPQGSIEGQGRTKGEAVRSAFAKVK